MKLTVTVEDQVEKASIYSEAINYESCLLLRRWGCCFHGMPFVFEALSVVYQSLYYRSAETFPPKWYQPISDSSLPAACFYFCLFQAINNSFTFLQAEFLWASLSLGWKIYWLHLRVGLVSMAIIPIAAFSSRILIISVPFC